MDLLGLIQANKNLTFLLRLARYMTLLTKSKKKKSKLGDKIKKKHKKYVDKIKKKETKKYQKESGNYVDCEKNFSHVLKHAKLLFEMQKIHRLKKCNNEK